jgi:N6-L-threonylcarbamoyladenine synthase
VRRLILGIDTSNYTTSLCAVDDTGALIAEARRLLPVAPGQRGLRQSEALFLHVLHLPVLMAELRGAIWRAGIQAWSWAGVGVSVRPRPWCTSYMPVFHAGESFAAGFAQATGIPMVRTSHQEGHLAAAAAFTHGDDEPFIAVHLSGGTSDVVWARPTPWGYAVEMIGEGADLHAGQFVDRVGVAMGLPFPAGPALERLATQVTSSSFRLASSVRGAQMSFSGPCSAALRAIEQGVPGPDIAFAVQACIANSLVKAISYAALQYPSARRVLVAGGVASNQWIRNRVIRRLGVVHPGLRIDFAPAPYASDNALGVARIAARGLRRALS